MVMYFSIFKMIMKDVSFLECKKEREREREVERERAHEVHSFFFD